MQTLTLGGRNFRVIETSTLEHLLWMDRQVAEAGLPSIFSDWKPQETVAAFAGRIWEQISKSRQALPLLGGMLMPAEKADTDWTPEEAQANIQFLKKLTAPEDHAGIRSLLLSVVLGFFGAARDFSSLSSIASASREASPSGISRPSI